MPASYSHYRIGKLVINQLHDPLKQIILDNLDLFNLGLHGPDILFYNRPYLHSKINRLGSSMHQQTASSFFYHALTILKETKNKAQLAYLCGYVCHYILDSSCHGYIDKIIKKTKITHFEIETELDRYFMIKDNLDPLRTHLTNHIKITDDIIITIKPFYRATEKELFKSLKGMKFYDRLLLAPQIYKRGLIYLVLKITFTFKRFQGFVVNYQANQVLTQYIKQLEKLFNQSIDEAAKEIDNFVDALKYNHKLSARFNHNFKWGCNKITFL